MLFLHWVVILAALWLPWFLVVVLPPSRSYTLTSLFSIRMAFRSMILVMWWSDGVLCFFNADETTCSYRRHETAFLWVEHIVRRDRRSRKERISDTMSPCSRKNNSVVVVVDDTTRGDSSSSLTMLSLQCKGLVEPTELSFACFASIVESSVACA